MEETSLLIEVREKLRKLEEIISLTEQRIIKGEDSLFLKNVNFYTKTYLVMQCVYLEAYIKEVVFYYICEINSKIKQIQIPYNLVRWSISNPEQVKKGDRKYESYEIKISQQEISEKISSNPYKTSDVFEHIGIDLGANTTFQRLKPKVNSIVTKRNNIIHHDDNASDVSNRDLIENIKVIEEYVCAIDQAICTELSKL